jgi:hypothetical protein
MSNCSISCEFSAKDAADSTAVDREQFAGTIAREPSVQINPPFWRSTKHLCFSPTEIQKIHRSVCRSKSARLRCCHSLVIFA